MFPNTFSQKRMLVFIGALFLVTFSIFLLLILSFTSRPDEGISFTTPTPIPDGSISPIQYTFIGETTQEEVEKLRTIEKKENLPDGTTRYLLKSPLLSRKNEIVTQNGRVVFERILVPESPSAKGYAKISEYKSRFGEPEESIRGSRFYGELLSTLIYAKNGFALIGNRRTDEVFEIQHFSPMSIEEYKQRYGSDIEESGGIVR